ncbi:UvrD-helicase domain-containing protein [Bifidobacterium sp.]|uniref:UvrD-helicase domain-containing protein n=1 Tax=Bifidobacterium sp. TaxID=41200 RepID=UPI0025BA1EC5|nr:UvrD-helicase domain-containing protein [Bifidobacterium sp.]
MVKQVVLAVAGAGKTYRICHAIDPEKRNFILAFTHENVANIQRELIDAFGTIPELTTISTFHSFVYHNLILPYEPSIGVHFGCAQFDSKGITPTDPPPQRIKSSDGKMIPNRRYVAKDKLPHYIDGGSRYYCATLSELALQVNCGKTTLVNRAAKRLNLFYDEVCIDEFQDFRKHDYDLIVKLSKTLNNVTLVGDYFQHSVSGQNNSGKPFVKGKVEIGYQEFRENLKKEGFAIDEKTLCKSRRCAPAVCSFVSEKLDIPIASLGNNKGEVIWVEEDSDAILSNDRITKLVYNNSDGYAFRSVNWSYSKGDTMDSTCVVLTDRFEKLAEESFSLKGISRQTINKLYVALTRSRGDVYLMRASVFKSVRDRYCLSKRI